MGDGDGSTNRDGVAHAELDALVVGESVPSARDLLVTIFGDAVVPYGIDTALSVSALAELLEPFGVNERLVRTSLSRLANDGYLEAESRGRRSFYRIAETAIPLFYDAIERTYLTSFPAWDGEWTMVIFDGAECAGESRTALKSALVAGGFGVVTPTVLMSHEVSIKQLELIAESARGDDDGCLDDHAIVSRTPLAVEHGDSANKRVALQVLPIAEMGERCGELVEMFGRFARPDLAELDPESAFKLRIMMISAYRKIRIEFPLIPRALLPEPWIGDDADELVAMLYQRCAGASEQFFGRVMSQPDNMLAPPQHLATAEELATRFARLAG